MRFPGFEFVNKTVATVRLFLMGGIVTMGLSACNEQGIHSISDGGDGDGPRIEVEPDYLDFGLASRDDPAVMRQFTVRSVGATDLEVSDLFLEGDDGASFTVISPLTNFVLPPGAEEVFDVAFTPMGANDQMAQVIIESNDPDTEYAMVELVGAGAVPELEIYPDPLDFSSAYIGCEKDDLVELTNVGTDTLVIEEIGWSGDAEFSLWPETVPVMPLTLEPGEQSQLWFSFNPSDASVRLGELQVTSNEPMGLRTAIQQGSGKYADDQTDIWEIPTDPPSDILFAVDQSCSMDDDQWTLANNFGTFIEELSDYSNDWQIIVANDDNGCNNSGLLRPTMSESTYSALFSSAVSSGGGSHTESLLTVGANAISNTDSGECNSGFLRPDAMLHIILVSDEPEQSSYTSGYAWNQLTQQIIDLKGSAGMVRISAIAGPVPSGCGSADPGTGYSEAVAATGGVFLSICSNWATPSNLSQLAEASINQDTFALSREAAESTIVVFVNGSLRTDWVYDPDGNTVTVNGGVPTEGDSVEISYSVLANCD